MTYKRNIDSYIDSHKEKECYISGRGSSMPYHAYSLGNEKADRVNEHLYFGGEYTGWNSWILLANPLNKISSIELQFNKFANDWKKQTAIYSNTLHITRNDNYLDIIGMGKEALPFILKDLEKSPDHWFVALKAIAKENPVPKEAYGNIEQMRHYWLQWGKTNNII
jgi:hypothetical protein